MKIHKKNIITSTFYGDIVTKTRCSKIEPQIKIQIVDEPIILESGKLNDKKNSINKKK